MITADGYFADQPVVPGADVIYRPKGNAGEYAPLATNPYVGCGHGCKYCYVPNATHIDRKRFNEGAVPRDGYIDRLARDTARYRAHGICDGHAADQVFITFSSDPFHLGDLTRTRATINVLQAGGMAVCTLSKGGLRALPFLNLYRPERDAYAATLTTLDDDFSRKWEPFAALPRDRIAALSRFHEAGIFTWVSLEPTLDVQASRDIIAETRSFVNHYKIGRANYLKEITRTTDWRDYTLRVTDLCMALGVSHYIKRDLQQFLPPGYPNDLRVVQRHPKRVSA
ncbi:radical SAM protein [Bradyrhizobium cenepequi]